VSTEEGRQRRVSSERCNCLCPGCLTSNLERETSAGCFNSLTAALLRAGRADDVTAPAPASCAAATPAAKLPEVRVQHFQENRYLSPYALKCRHGSGAASRSDHGSTNLVFRFFILNQKSCGHGPQIADGYTHARAQISSKHTERLTLHPQPFTLNRVLPTRLQLAKPRSGAWTDLTET